MNKQRMGDNFIELKTQALISTILNLKFITVFYHLCGLGQVLP
jgi:hypothetical protein